MHTPLVPCLQPAMTASALATTDTASDLPAWAAPASPEPQASVVGISQLGELYLYGDSADKPGPIVPAILGYVTGLNISQHGAASKYGLRDYLDLYLVAPGGDAVILRLPCNARPSLPYSIRSLLAGLNAVDLQAQAVKLQARRGTDANFFRVIPFSPDGAELPEIRNGLIGPDRNDLEIAVNHLRQCLSLPPLFTTPYDQ